MRPDRLYQFHAPSIVKLILAQIQRPDLRQLASVHDIQQRTDPLRREPVRCVSDVVSANTIDAQLAQRCEAARKRLPVSEVPMKRGECYCLTRWEAATVDLQRRQAKGALLKSRQKRSELIGTDPRVYVQRTKQSHFPN